MFLDSERKDKSYCLPAGPTLCTYFYSPATLRFVWVAAATATDQTTPLLEGVYLVMHTSPYLASAFNRELFMSQLPRMGLWCCLP